jgi:hypothetical protein
MAEEDKLDKLEDLPNLDNLPNGNLDWADAAVPVLASIAYVIKQGKLDPALVIGTGLGYALAVALMFGGVRQIMWTINRRRAKPSPRRPLLAVLVGLLIWGFIIFHR